METQQKLLEQYLELMDQNKKLKHQLEIVEKLLSDHAVRLRRIEVVFGIEKAAAAATTANKCVICNDSFGTLELDDGRFICEDCAQHMNDIAP